jgi:UDP-N-acetylglucosamine 2-epimerase (non-hydrolysing)
MTSVNLYEEKVVHQIEKSIKSGYPLLICLIATKACYIKFSGLVRALAEDDYPFLALQSGQHYEPLLTEGANELKYIDLIHGSMHLQGDLVGKSSALFETLNSLWARLKVLGARQALLCVCGDTLTAGVAPFAWYMITGQRSVHVEAGLRSESPRWDWINGRSFLHQRFMPWDGSPTRPFPEGLCTRIATVASQQLYAPVERNVRNLWREGFDAVIYQSGSPSVDAVKYAEAHLGTCTTGSKKLRVDIHRRENLTHERLSAVFGGLKRLANDGHEIEFVITRSMQNCKGTAWQKDDIEDLVKHEVKISLQTASYLDVVRYLKYETRALYTDSGGLQEESTILGIPCITCRYETDRPETVLDFQTNILVPPKSDDYVHACISECLGSDPKVIWPGLGKHQYSYGAQVGKGIVRTIKEATVEPVTESALK